VSRLLTLYSRPGCHLCEVMKATVEATISGRDVILDEVNVDLDSDLVGRFGDQVPVLVLDGRRIAKYRIDAETLTRALESRVSRETTSP